jgi:hypothetical protein
VDEPQAGPLGDNQIYQDWYNRSLDKGPLANDIVHRFVTVGLWELPAGHGRAFFQHGVLEKVLGGWNLTPAFIINWGGQFTVTAGNGTATNSPGYRADVVADPNLPWSSAASTGGSIWTPLVPSSRSKPTAFQADSFQRTLREWKHGRISE